MIAITDTTHRDADTGIPAPGPISAPGPRDECGFPGETEAEATCREIPVATISDTCGNGHMNLLRACTGHADEVASWNGDFIGDIGSPGVLTCPQCESNGEPAMRLNVTLIWDDMRAVEVIQAR